MTAQEYINNCSNAINQNPVAHNWTRENWRYAARCIGSGLSIWPDKECQDAIKSFYSTCFARLHISRGAKLPDIDNKDFMKWMLGARNESKI